VSGSAERSPFQYALLRVVPHVDRGESINAGVVVLCRPRRFLAARVALDEGRLEALAPGTDPGPIRERLDMICRIAAGDPAGGPIASMELSERFHWIVAPSSTVIQPGPVHTGLCADPEALTDKLFDALVALPDLSGMRRSYERSSLSEASLAPTWLEQFELWFAEAAELGRERNAMVVATNGPAARTVLLKHVDDRGFVFFTNLQSAKGRELTADPRAALVFPWIEQERQVLVRGTTELLGAHDNDVYWASRPIGSQLSAAVSPQSDVIESRAALESARASLESAGGDVARPPHWGGVRVVPQSIEFWQGREDRLHDRLRFRRADGGWVVERLAP
jgi:pyridoxamine 5'-phosphate oxidase